MVLMDPGALDRRITIQARTMSRDDTGSRIESWVDLVSVWAKREKETADESTIAGSERPRQRLTWKIRHRVVDSTSHRITYKGDTFEIVGITEAGGRENFLILETYALEGVR